MRFAKIVFTIAGIWGLLALTPMYFVEQRFHLEHPPALTHPEYFYGFAGVGIAWQVAFLIIGRDPIRYRPLMLACMIEKFSFVIACSALYVRGRLIDPVLGWVMVDLLLGTLFVGSYIKTASSRTLPKTRA